MIKKKIKSRIKDTIIKTSHKIKKRILKTKVKARIRKSRKDINKRISNFFDWIKGAEIVELKKCEQVMEEKYMGLNIKMKSTLLCVLLLPIKFLNQCMS